jgi:gas vesicle structural protein
MTVAQQYVARQSGGRGGPSGLADVLDVLLDKGLVIDAFVRVSLVGIELLTIDARVVVAGVDTYLHFAEAVNRLDLLQVNNSQTVPELFGSGPSRGSTNGRSSNGQSSNDKSRQALDESQQGHGGDEDDGNDQRASDQGGGERNGKGLLSRLADRGQAF